MPSPQAIDVCEFRPESRPTGQRRAADGAYDADAARLGRLWHALLEHQAGGTAAPAELAAGDGLGAEQARLAVQAAQRVLGAPALARFFDAAAPSWSELDIVDAAGEGLRIDRLVELDDAVWILDYKWSCSPGQKPQFERQLARYAGAIRTLYPGRPVRTALILSDATLVETVAGPGTDKIIDGGPPRIEAP
jgi:ATP-dependent helicase/nuclease subunit A